MPLVAKENETDVLATASNVPCQTRGELVFSLDAAKKDMSQLQSFPGNRHTLRRAPQTWAAALPAASLTRMATPAAERGCPSLPSAHAFYPPRPQEAVAKVGIHLAPSLGESSQCFTKYPFDSCWLISPRFPWCLAARPCSPCCPTGSRSPGCHIPSPHLCPWDPS